MQYLCLTMIFSGMFIIAYSIFQYYGSLKFMHNQNYDRKIFNLWIYGATFFMMTFFLIGYLIMGTTFIFSDYQPYFVLVALIFFFGAIFVFCMVKVQRMMAHTITEKTTETIQSMVRTMEAKDIYTKGHSEHVHNLVLLIYEHLPTQMKSKLNLVNLADAAMLHDIGKIGIPDQILNKPGKLTEEEFEIVKMHPKNGKVILENTCYRDVCQWILYHHERVDGNGYYKIPGMAVPLESRIISLADVFSALYTDRVYRKRFSFDEAIAILQEEAGTILDAELVRIFCNIDEEKINQTSVF